MQFNGAWIIFSTDGTRTTEHLHPKKKLHRPHTLTKANSIWPLDLTVKYKAAKFLEDKTGENINDLSYGDDF